MTNLQEFERIVEQYSNQLYQYCYRKLNYNKFLADEAFNDILKVLADKWDTLDLSGNIRAYIYRVADNCIKHNLREYKNYYKNNLSYDELNENRAFSEPAKFDEYFEEKYLSEKESIETIKNTLPPELQPIFYHRFIEKRTLNEIVEMTGIPYSSLRLRVSKTEKLVREEIKKLFS